MEQVFLLAVCCCEVLCLESKIQSVLYDSKLVCKSSMQCLKEVCVCPIFLSYTLAWYLIVEKLPMVPLCMYCFIKFSGYSSTPNSVVHCQVSVWIYTGYACVGLYIPLFLSEVVGGNRKDKKACVILERKQSWNREGHTPDCPVWMEP